MATSSLPDRRSVRNDDETAALAAVQDRVNEALSRADEVLSLVDSSWSPPPYDPLLVAQALGIRCVRMSSSSPHPAMLCELQRQLTILYREMRSPERTRFNLFHEIAHTLFRFTATPYSLGRGHGSWNRTDDSRNYAIRRHWSS